MKRLNIVLILLASVILATVLLAGSLLQTGSRQTGEPDTVLISITTRNWRFEPKVEQGHPGVEASFKLKDEAFSDSVIKVRKGDLVVLKIRNTESNQIHGFALEEFGVFEVTPPQQEVTLRFAAATTGTYTFFCNVFCGTGHPLHKGTLVVEG
ncbi:MAG: cupredoxin domain-containing protein [Thaumarchaeota archaeon]|nr:cupredoxin domain-containing protein [Nitrososphaerota archaeon]